MSLEKGFQNTILNILQKMIDEKRNNINHTQTGGSGAVPKIMDLQNPDYTEDVEEDTSQIKIEKAYITVNNIEQPKMTKNYQPKHGNSIEKKDFISCTGTVLLQFNNVKIPVKFTLTKDIESLNEQHRKDILGEN